MYIRKCYSTLLAKDKQKIHYQIAESYREKGKVKQRVIANLGQLNNKTIDSLIRAFHKLREQPYLPDELPNLIKHYKVFSYGDVFVINELWKRLDADKIINNLIKKEKIKIEFNLAKTTLLLIINRLLDPMSKLKLFKKGQKDIYLKELSNDNFDYPEILRTLEYLEKFKNQIEEKLFYKQMDLFNFKVDLVFYDLTSSYFEGAGPEMAEIGFSKDEKRGTKQILLALAVTKEGLPIGHEVYEGNKSEKTTVIQMVQKLKKRFQIDKCIFIGDRGMVSSDNIQKLEELNYEYIFAVKKRRLIESAEVIEKDLNKYQTIIQNNKEKVIIKLRYFEKNKGNNLRYVICHNDQIALKQEEKINLEIKEIEEKIKRILEKFKTSNVIFKKIIKIYGIDRYFDYELKNNKFIYQKNENKIAFEKLIAGKFILKTNNQTLNSKEIIEAYKNLCLVEDAFKEIKSFLKIRPMYHHKNERIKGHVFICVLAYLIEKIIEQYFKGTKMNARNVLEKLSQIKLIESKINGIKILKSVELNQDAKNILSRLKIPKIPTFLAPE